MNRPRSISINLPALSGIVLKQKKDNRYKLSRIKKHKR